MCTICGQRGPSPFSLFQRRGPFGLHVLYKKFIAEIQLIYFHLANCLKSFYFKLFFVYTSLRGPYGTFAHKFCFILKSKDLLKSKPVTSLGHQGERKVF